MTDLKPIPVILLADDDADDRLLVKDALRDGAFAGQIHSVEDGEELMDYLEHRGKFSDARLHPLPSLILLDLNMPRKSGREALREIKSDTRLRHIPVIVFTTSRADSDIAATYDLGANSFVTKPTAYQALVSVMETLQKYWLDLVQLPKPELRNR
ncbi:MAG: response regulator [Verrucomicrobia bacterium]|nr:MAG: response regulator [Verrucomicrobiota bacterium]